MDHLDEDTLSQLAGGTLDPGRAAAAADHLALCKVCVARHEALSAMLFSKTFYTASITSYYTFYLIDRFALKPLYLSIALLQVPVLWLPSERPVAEMAPA